MFRVLDIAILGLLMDRDHHGYEIRTQLRDRLGVWANVSFGSIYPALALLLGSAMAEGGTLVRWGTRVAAALASIASDGLSARGAAAARLSRGARDGGRRADQNPIAIEGHRRHAAVAVGGGRRDRD